MNDGEEVFVVFDGMVDMYYCEVGEEKVVMLELGDIFFVGVGCEYVVYLCGEVRIFVVEKVGSV